MSDASQLALAELIECCRSRTTAYLNTREVGDDSRCLELFRRAVQDGDQGAWAFIYTFYSTEEFLGDHYVLKWVRSWVNGRHGGVIRSSFTEEEVVQEIWLRFMRSDAARNFSFADMRHLMGFLRRLTNNFMLDLTRRRGLEIVETSDVDVEIVDTLLGGVPDVRASLDVNLTNQEDLDRLLHEIIGVIVTTPQEWLVFQGYFVDELPPRKLYDLHPTAFAPGEVETIRTRLTRRLRKAPYLLNRFIRLVVLNEDERQIIVFEQSLMAGWPDHRMLSAYPQWFLHPEDLLEVKIQVLAQMRSRPLLLKFLGIGA